MGFVCLLQSFYAGSTLIENLTMALLNPTVLLQHKLLKLPTVITRYTPDLVLEQLIAAGLNHLMATEIAQGELDFLQRKMACVNITDLNFCFSATLLENKIHVRVPAREAEVTLRTDQQALLEMLHAEIDPDTLFFQRRLLITGDTELGLELKNLIDRLELADRIPPALMKLISCIHSRQQQLAAEQAN